MDGNPDELWLTRQQCAILCRLSARQFDDAIRSRMPNGAKRGSGQKLRLSGPAVVAALVEYRVDQTKPSPTDEDPLLTEGGNSPNLERYRLAKAIDAETTNAERSMALVNRQVFISALRPAVSAMGQAGEVLVKRFGNEAGDIFREAVDEFESAAERVANQFDAKRGPDVPRDGRGDAPAAHPHAK